MIRKVQLGFDAHHYFLVPAETDDAAIAAVRGLLAGEWADDPLRVVEVRDDHHAVGHRFRAPLADEAACTCIAFDWRVDYWMQFPSGKRRDVSFRAIDRTFHRIRERES